MAKKKNELSHYPRFFLSKVASKIVCWVVFSALFVNLGKKYLETDIIGKIWGSIFGKKRDFSQYFLGTGRIGKNKILNYAIFFLVVIIVLNVIVLLFNKYLWEKDRYIENNKFYLHNKWIFIFSSLIHIANACLLTLSFISPLTAILALLFITFNSLELFPWQRKSRNPHTERFFSWKNQYVLKIALYSAIIVLIVPLVVGRFREFHNNTLESAPEGFAKIYQTMVNSSLTLRSFIELITQTNFGVFHWFVLLWFVRCIINERQKEFTDFWTKVNGIEKRVSNFKCYYHYQESWASANNKPINLGDYKYLENSPNLLRKDYLAGDLDINNFAQRNQKVIEYIDFCENKIKEAPKRNFLNYCLFNEFNSWKDCLRNKKLIEAARK